MKTRPRLTKQEASRLLIALAALALIALCLKLIIRQPTTEAVAKDMLQAIFRGDASSIAHRLPEYELSKVGMTRAKAERFLSDFVLPKFADASLTQSWITTQGGGMTAFATADLMVPGTAPYRLTFDVHQSDDGPIILLRNVLEAAWCVEFLKAKDPEYRNRLQINATLWGIQKDRSALLSYGFKGFVADDEAAPLTSLDQAIENLTRFSQQPASTELPDGPPPNLSRLREIGAGG